MGEDGGESQNLKPRRKLRKEQRSRRRNGFPPAGFVRGSEGGESPCGRFLRGKSILAQRTQPVQKQGPQRKTLKHEEHACSETGMNKGQKD